MSRKVKIGVGLVVVGYLAFWFINNFVYPFFPDSPNFKDVERVFNRMQFPAEWEEIDSSENKGLHGRACPVESKSWCFHKSKTFRLNDINEEAIEGIMKMSGCPQVSVSQTQSTSGNSTTNLACSAEGLTVDGSFNERKKELYFAVRS